MKSEPTEIASNTNVRAIEVDPTAAAGTLRERIAKETPDKRPFVSLVCIEVSRILSITTPKAVNHRTVRGPKLNRTPMVQIKTMFEDLRRQHTMRISHYS